MTPDQAEEFCRWYDARRQMSAGQRGFLAAVRANRGEARPLKEAA